VGGLEHTIGINVLVATTGHAESIPCFLSGRVGVLVAKADLSELILGVELAGGDSWGSSNDRSHSCEWCSHRLGSNRSGSCVNRNRIDKSSRGSMDHRGLDSIHNSSGGKSIDPEAGIDNGRGDGIDKRIGHS